MDIYTIYIPYTYIYTHTRIMELFGGDSDDSEDEIIIRSSENGVMAFHTGTE